MLQPPFIRMENAVKNIFSLAETLDSIMAIGYYLSKLGTDPIVIFLSIIIVLSTTIITRKDSFAR